jgi:hypothetical protein
MYNGKDEYPEEAELNLSDAFIGNDPNNPVNLNLKVKVYNVNRGRNSKIMSRSSTLTDYSIFISKARENVENGLELRLALEKTVRDCIQEGILKEFLERNSSEVVNMMSMEWSLDDALRVREMDGRQKERIEMAKEMLLDGELISKIMKYTKLTKAKIEELKAELKI